MISIMLSPTLRVYLLLILVLQMLHLPLPCPDLDWECRGTPILSLADANAWHLLITGIRPNDDIDRGPFRSDDSDRHRVPSDSLYGDLAISGANVSAISRGIELNRSPYCPALGFVCSRTSAVAEVRLIRSIGAVWIPDARTRRVKTCVWRI